MFVAELLISPCTLHVNFENEKCKQGIKKKDIIRKNSYLILLTILTDLAISVDFIIDILLS